MSGRKLYLIGPITEDMYSVFSEQLDFLIKENPTKPIDVEISSGGGDEDAALALYDKIKSCSAPIIMTAFGVIQSAAVLVYAAGDKRVAAPQTVFMVHESTAKLKGFTRDLVTEIGQLQKQENTFDFLLSLCTSTGVDNWRRLSRATTYFTSGFAYDLGLVDSILVYPTKGKRKYVRK